MNPETRETINWLNSWEGRRWSRNIHKQPTYGYKLFSLKEDNETAYGTPLQEWTDWGKIDQAGRYHKPRNLKDTKN